MFEPILTSRLVLRAPVASDLDALVKRRNDTGVAKHQDWPLPFDAESGRSLLAAVASMGGPIRGQWWMISVVDRQRPAEPPLGDLAVHLSEHGYEAEIGYTFAAAHHGHGYATEAVAALLQHLFDDLGVTHVSASVHPDNTASVMLLERTGFVYEGRTRNMYWRHEGDQAVFSDALLYGVTTSDHQDWHNRLTGPATDVALVEITPDNARSVAEITTHKSQERLVTPTAKSFGDALFPEVIDGAPVVPWLRAIQADNELVGFVMVALRTAHHPNPYLWRLLIGRMHQRRGIGNRALDLVEQICRDTGATAIEVSWEEGRGSPAPFYEARGYVRTGRIVDGETEAIKTLL